MLVDPKDPDWHLEMIPEWNRNERVAYLRMTDTRGETYFSELKHLTSYNLIPVTQNEVYQEFRNIQILAKKGDLVTGHDAGLRFSILFRNSGKEDIRVDAAKIRLENKETTQNIHSYEITLAADEEDEMEVFLPMIAIKGMELPETVLEAEIFFTVREREGESEEVSIRIPMTLKTSMFRE